MDERDVILGMLDRRNGVGRSIIDEQPQPSMGMLDRVPLMTRMQIMDWLERVPDTPSQPQRARPLYPQGEALKAVLGAPEGPQSTIQPDDPSIWTTATRMVAGDDNKSWAGRTRQRFATDVMGDDSFGNRPMIHPSDLLGPKIVSDFDEAYRHDDPLGMVGAGVDAAGAALGPLAKVALKTGKKVLPALAAGIVVSPDEAEAAAGGKATRAAIRQAREARNMAELPNLRTMPVDEAADLARRDLHLKESGDRSEGLYMGGARDVLSKKDLKKIRKAFDEFVAADPRGGDWYDRYRAAINEVTGGDPRKNEWVSRMEGQWSAGVDPASELAFALREGNAAIVRPPDENLQGGIKAGRPASHESYMRAVAENDPSHLAKGEKTGEYATLINPDLAAQKATGVNDFRHQRNLGYTNPDGSLPSSGNHMVGSAIHKFMDYETAAAVDRANKTNLGGRSNWTGEQIQAAPWVRQKAESIMAENPALTYDEAFARANTQIGDYYPKHTFNATGEALPGPSTGHLPGLQQADQATKDAYAAHPASTWATAPGGRDVIYNSIDDGGGAFMRVQPTTPMMGVYGDQMNRGEVARPLFARSVNAGGAGNARMPSEDYRIGNTAEYIRAYVDAQDAGAGHMNFARNTPGDMGSLSIPNSGALTREQAQALQEVGARYGLPNVVDTGRGVTMTDFMAPFGPSGKATGKALKKGLLDDLRAALPGAEMPRRVYTDSVYAPLEKEWRQGVGSGAATKKLMGILDITPGVRDKVTNSPGIAERALAKMDRDAEIAGATGDTLRPDIQNARRIIAENPRDWVGALKAALARGEVLPAVALPLLAAAGASQLPADRGEGGT